MPPKVGFFGFGWSTIVIVVSMDNRPTVKPVLMSICVKRLPCQTPKGAFIFLGYSGGHVKPLSLAHGHVLVSV